MMSKLSVVWKSIEYESFQVRMRNKCFGKISDDRNEGLGFIMAHTVFVSPLANPREIGS